MRGIVNIKVSLGVIFRVEGGECDLSMVYGGFNRFGNSLLFKMDSW